MLYRLANQANKGRTVKAWLAALAIAMTPGYSGAAADLNAKAWNYGSEDCRSNRDPAIEVFQFDAATYILRQNKCVHFEAPFIYVLFGEDKVLVLDTGATAEPERFPLYDTVQKLIDQRGAASSAKPPELLVAHSHSHSDHTAADTQFRGKPSVTLVEPNAKALRGYFGFSNWPESTAKIDLGGRELVVMPIPGHQDESIAVHDPRTGWLLTGDTVYPGHLYVKDWNAYRASIRRLAEFSQARRVSAVMGAHIEMSGTPGKAFPSGSTHQPDEARLALTVEDLWSLDRSLRQAGAKPKEIAMAKFIVTPIDAFQRALGTVLKWIGAR